MDEREAIEQLIMLKKRLMTFTFGNIKVFQAINMGIIALADQELNNLYKKGGEEMDGS